MMSNDNIGIDVSKDFLDAHRQRDGAAARFSNTPAGFRDLSTWLGGDMPSLVVFEATGPHRTGRWETETLQANCVALRCEKTKRNFASFVALAGGFILVKSIHSA